MVKYIINLIDIYYAFITFVYDTDFEASAIE